jgi:hypothetical protein
MRDVTMILCDITAPIETYYILKEPFNVGDATILQNNGKMFISATGRGNGKGEARNDALDKIRKACLSWSLRMNESLRFDDFLTKEIYTENGQRIGLASFSMNALLVKDTLNEVEISDIKHFSDTLKNSDEYGLKAATYFERALIISPYKNEAFLNFYKVSELIAQHITEPAESVLKKWFRKLRDVVKMRRRITTKEKMIRMCEILKIDTSLSSKTGHLVDVRNRYDVGHARLAEIEVSIHDFNDCRNLALEVILSYLRLNT